ncbi:MAG: O-antigen ligase family protein [Nitrospira sp.]|nr:O-antigen ligase family protein [Nitrospira sp.]
MVEFKYYIFFLGTGFALLLAVGAAMSEKIAKWAFAGFLLSTMYMVDINFMSHEWYRGSTRGFEFSTSDLLLIVLLGLVLVRHFVSHQNESQTEWLPVGSIPFLMFIGVAGLSLSKAHYPLFGMFELSKLIKGYLIFWSIGNLAQGADFRRVAFGSLCLVVIVEVGYGAFQHFSGVYRIQGSLGHPNSYAMYLNMLIPIMLAAALRMPDWRKQFLLLGLVAGGAASVIVTFSRGGWMALFLALVCVCVLSIRQDFSFRNGMVIAIACVLCLGLILKAMPRMIERWTDAPERSLYSRLQMNQAGYLMVSQSPWIGIGINNSAAWFADKEKEIRKNTLQGPNMFDFLLGSLQLSNEKLEQEITPVLYVENGVLIHNIYIVTAAETGIVGCALFIFLGIRFLFVSGRLAIQKQTSEMSWWVIGIFCAFLAVYVQGLAEWEMRQTPLWYLFCALAGLLIGQMQLNKYANTQNIGLSMKGYQGEVSFVS